MIAHPDIDLKQPDLKTITKAALTDEVHRQQLFTLFLPGSKRSLARYNSYRALLLLSEINPKHLLPQWNQLVEMLSSRIMVLLIVL